MVEFQFASVREDGAFVVAAAAGDALEEFFLPLALQRRDAENLAGIKLERNVIEERAAAQSSHFQRGLRVARALATRRRRRRGRGRCRGLAQHERDNTLLA